MQSIRTLLLTGANNHDWARTAPFIKAVLESSGRFTVTLAEDASGALEGDLSAYDLLFLDYNGPMWSETAKSNFIAAVQGGTGVCIYHAANNAFEGWTEYEQLVGLLWRTGTGHGQFHEFEVAITDSEHPITRGLKSFRTEDELYHRLVPTPGTEVQVLATAFSSEESGGSGAHEPMLMVTQYGAGRLFHTALGHVWAGDPAGEYRGASLVAIENHGFQTSLLRGCEWAATAKVV